MSYSVILFDLDGTLSDSAEGILNGFAYTYKKLGKPLPPHEKLLTYIGPPLDKSFSDDFPADKILEVLDVFREYYHKTGLYENKTYDGVREMLEALRAAGKRLFVATSKGEASAREIITEFGLIEYFERVYGAFLRDGIKTKTDVLKRLFEHEPDIDKADVILVGDTAHDARGAQDTGIAFGAVTYGYGKRRDFDGFDVEFFADKPEQTTAFLLQNKQ